MYYMLHLTLILAQNIVVVLDAGFTSTKLNVYGFDGYVLNFAYTKFYYPGLHELQIDRIAGQMARIADDARSVIRSRHFDVRRCRIAFVATEGLRSMESGGVDEILRCVGRSMRERLGTDRKAEVSVMTGTFEGLYAYESLVYLLFLRNDMKMRAYALVTHDKNAEGYEIVSVKGSVGGKIRDKNAEDYDIVSMKGGITSKNTKKEIKLSVGIIEMGGGSAQIAFSTLADGAYRLFIHSFHELGLIKGKRLLRPLNLLACHDFNSRCIGHFRDRFSLHQLVQTMPINTVDKFFLISFFYDRLSALNVHIHKFGDVIEAYKAACVDHLTSDCLCSDIAYIIMVLKGIGLDEDTNVEIVRQIGGVNINWGLAKALEIL